MSIHNDKSQGAMQHWTELQPTRVEISRQESEQPSTLTGKDPGNTYVLAQKGSPRLQYKDQKELIKLVDSRKLNQLHINRMQNHLSMVDEMDPSYNMNNAGQIDPYLINS